MKVNMKLAKAKSELRNSKNGNKRLEGIVRRLQSRPSTSKGAVTGMSSGVQSPNEPNHE